MPKRYVGKNIYKVDAQDKVTGKAIYPDDIYFDDILKSREPLILMPIYAE